MTTHHHHHEETTMATTDEEYIRAVHEALDAGKSLTLTDRCPECEDTLTLDDLTTDGVHEIVHVSGDEVAVIVGCEGYWVIPPAEVGIDAPQWGPPEEF